MKIVCKVKNILIAGASILMDTMTTCCKNTNEIHIMVIFNVLFSCLATDCKKEVLKYGRKIQVGQHLLFYFKHVYGG